MKIKLLTKKQNDWIYNREIKINQLYMFPRFGFIMYTTPSDKFKIYIDNNPFTKSLDKELFHVKDKINGYYKGNFYKETELPDFYIHENELSKRSKIHSIFLLIVSFIPMIVYNLFITKKQNYDTKKV